MIVTLTANPSLDRTIMLDAALRPGDVQAARSAREDAGGKGINVSRVVAAAGVGTTAVLPLASDDPYHAAVREARVPLSPVAVSGHVRANITITDPQGTTTKLNLPGAVIAPAEAAAIIDAVVDASAGARWLVLAGSLPPGVDEMFYVDVIRAVRDARGDDAPRIAVDTSGPALLATVEHGAPDLIKPNDEELAALADAEIDPDADDVISTVIEVARLIVPSRARSALVTLGARGAVLVDAEAAWVGVPPRIRVASTVGAGDSSLAGFVLAESEGATPADCLRSAIRYGAAAASLPGTQAPSPLDLPPGDVAVVHHP